MNTTFEFERSNKYWLKSIMSINTNHKKSCLLEKENVKNVF